MHLPNRKKAYILEEKLSKYLLSTEHPIGKTKARFFNRHGFTKKNITLLKNELFRIAHQENVVFVEETKYGAKYAVDGFINTPKNEKIKLRTIWIIEGNKNEPRLITSYPTL